MLYQQGDVLLEKIDGPIEGKKLDHLILAEGEATGHNHRVRMVGGQISAALYRDKNKLYLAVGEKGVTIEHEEHKPITVPMGSYRVRKVREYDHFLEMARRVSD